jgi:hypothetical protein
MKPSRLAYIALVREVADEMSRCLGTEIPACFDGELADLALSLERIVVLAAKSGDK